ncbi:multiple sugar transport system permease protein [Pseudarthrobacter defluvii]|uniref:carbohydrate ABC transporter permease n=1 Tax=Pseudarthrobacter defluvii TaxID=410837 RepID=UPI00278B3295|nr:sugar ABC transporter permease [Pseudarthrobacter defluvii]MDQ0770399.1 multiple sugar transport system permease protein [Pseudarthrobacter defluvii]
MTALPTLAVKNAKKPARVTGHGKLAAVYLAPGMLGFLIFIVVPLVASLVISLFDWPLFGAPKFVGLDNYVRMLSGDPVFWTVLGNTLFFAVCYTVLNLVLALALSTWLHSLGGWGPFFRVLFFIPVVTPMVANALVWRLMLTDDGVVNSFLANFGIHGPSWLSDSQLAMGSLIVMSVWQGIGYNIIVLGAGLNGISPNLLEAARIDGAGALQRFFRVVLPMLSPSLFFCTVMTIIGSFKVFTQPYLLTLGGPGESTNTIVLYLYRNGFSFDKLGYASALAWALFVIVMLITALQFSQQKRLVNYDN